MMATCKACQDPLVVPLEADDSDEEQEQEQTVPDDLTLPCGCHFHWQCLHDQAAEIAVSLKCPSCSTYLPSNAAGPSSTNAFLQTPQGASILARYVNEGGVQDDLDILPTLTEEAYLSAHPEARPARAFHLMAGEGDVGGMVEVLQDVDSDEEEEMDAQRLLRWVDPLNGGKTVLHVAIEGKQEEVLWMLLWLGADLPASAFPQAVASAAAEMGLPHPENVTRDQDVRFMKDERGKAPGDLLAEMGPPWSTLVDGGLFLD
jgi:hypothetical protein